MSARDRVIAGLIAGLGLGMAVGLVVIDNDEPIPPYNVVPASVSAVPLIDATSTSTTSTSMVRVVPLIPKAKQSTTTMMAINTTVAERINATTTTRPPMVESLDLGLQ